MTEKTAGNKIWCPSYRGVCLIWCLSYLVSVLRGSTVFQRWLCDLVCIQQGLSFKELAFASQDCLITATLFLGSTCPLLQTTMDQRSANRLF